MSHTIREHLKTFHQNSEAHHNGLAACYKSVAALTKSSKSQMKDEDQTNELSDCLDKFVTHHEHMADYHQKAMAECEKIAADDLNKNSSDLLKRLEVLEGTIQPTRISAITPNRPGVTAVPRAGQQPIPTRPNVPIQFEKLVSIEE